MSEDQWTTTRTLAATRPVAFAHFVDDFGQWWPPDYTFAGERLAQIGIEARPGGGCFEVDNRGDRIAWGAVEAIDRPALLVFTWAITPDRRVEPDPERCSRVTARFQELDDARCSLILTHHDFARHGADWASYRDMLASPMGWPLILDRFADYCAGAGGAAVGR